MDPQKTVFLSYRRDVSWAMAHLVRNDLVQHGFDVFMDVGSLGGGAFEPVILREIERRAHFLVLLEPRSLDRISDEGDWLRREIACALAHERNVVPLLANGALMARAADLPIDVARLPTFNAVSVPHDYFPEAMQKLREQFLRGAPSSADQERATDGDATFDRLRPAPQWRRFIEVDRGLLLRWVAEPDAVEYEVQVRTEEKAGRALNVRELMIYRGTHLSCMHERERSRVGTFAWTYRVRARFAGGVVGSWSDGLVVRAS